MYTSKNNKFIKKSVQAPYYLKHETKKMNLLFGTFQIKNTFKERTFNVTFHNVSLRGRTPTPPHPHPYRGRFQ